jgi:NAD(P)H dehydrogenase (quinone)
MKCLVVKAHPLAESLCSTLARRAVEVLDRAGHQVELEDLYAENFDAALTERERCSYYSGAYAADEVKAQWARLSAAQGVVLVFPTWWFGFPAILKGWFDRVWAPGLAYEHAGDLGPIRPRLDRLHHVLAVTTLGSPWWVDKLVLRQPVRRVLQRAIVGTCAPRARFRMLSHYRSEILTPARVQRYAARIDRELARWPL